MMFAQRYPAYFDGIAICAPAMSVSSGATIAAAWDTQTYLSIAPANAEGQGVLSQALSDSDLSLVAGSITTACDATDGATDDISYTFDNSTGLITRTLNNTASSATVADNITAFTFTYLDANGASTTTNTSVRRITINITARTAKPDPSYTSNSGYRTYQISADVTPPNLAL